MYALVGTAAPGSIADFMDRHCHDTHESVADAIIARWPEVLRPCSWTERGYGLTRKKLIRIVRERARLAQKETNE